MADKDIKKKRHWPAIIIVASCAVIFLVSSMTYTVSNSEHVIVTRFGTFSKNAEEGLNFKMPYPIDDIVRIDKRLQHFEKPLAQTALKDLRNFLVALSAGWKVKDAAKFHKTLGSLSEGAQRMSSIMGTSTSSIFPEYQLDQIFTTDEKNHKVDEIRKRVLEDSNKVADQYGIEIVSVGFTQMALPPDATKSGLERMRLERQVKAEKERSKGRQDAQEIKSKANEYAQGVMNEAITYASNVRTEGDKKAYEYYKDFKNPDFVIAIKQLESLKKVLSKKTQMVIDMNTPPFNLLKGEYFEELMKKQAEKKK